MKDVFKVPDLRTISFVIAVILAVPLSMNMFTGLFIWLSPFIMLNSVLALKSFVLLNAIGFLILAVVIFRKRWFCNNLCPVGWSCDKVSNLSTKSFTYRRVPDFGRWLAIISLSASVAGLPFLVILDPLAIFNSFFSIFSGEINFVRILLSSIFPVLLLIHLLLPGIWCKKICPLGGLQLTAHNAGKILKRISGRAETDGSAFNPHRRYFLMAGAGLGAGFLVPPVIKPSEQKKIRPPAAAGPLMLNFLCCRCGSCSRVCPTGIIFPSADTNYPLSWLTPELKFSEGYCLETCNLCSTVCPTGAISLFSVEAKSELIIGKAEIELENCLLLNNKECIKCKESCKFEAIDFAASGNILNTVPVINFKRCVGCGACAVVCPQECIFISPPVA